MGQTHRRISVHEKALDDSKSCRAVIFDLHGVLINTEPLKFQAWKEACASTNSQWILEQDTYKHWVGMSTDEIARRLLMHFSGQTTDLTSLKSFQTMHYVKLRHLSRPDHDWTLPGTDLLKRLLDMNLPNVKLAVVSSGDRQEVYADLFRMSIPTDGLVIITKLDVEQHYPDIVDPLKPKPFPYLLAMTKLEVTSDQCTIVEDTESGVQAALAAGISSVWIMPNTMEYEVQSRPTQKWIRYLDSDTCHRYPEQVCNVLARPPSVS